MVNSERCGNEAERKTDYSVNGMQERTNIVCKNPKCNYTKFGKWM
jgi:hypothetical protein